MRRGFEAVCGVGIAGLLALFVGGRLAADEEDVALRDVLGAAESDEAFAARMETLRVELEILEAQVAAKRAEIGRERADHRASRLARQLDLARHHGAIHRALDRVITPSFPGETPLEDVLTLARQETISDALPEGIPYYVDPIGLQEADVTLRSPVTIHLEGIKLGTSLRLALKQLGLAATVRDGLYTITSRESVDRPSEPGDDIHDAAL